MTEDVKTPQGSDEQLLYARILETGMFVGLVLLLITFALYISGLVAPAVPVEDLPKFWKMDVHGYLEAPNNEYLHHPHIITGWSWVSVLGKGDYLNFVGIALLSAVTIVCFVGIVPTLLRKKDRVYATMAVLEALILALAASGILSVGH